MNGNHGIVHLHVHIYMRVRDKSHVLTLIRSRNKKRDIFIRDYIGCYGLSLLKKKENAISQAREIKKADATAV